ncbi:MAG: matrixin family metalloprotease [Polyangiaceae bacterium]
MQKSLLGTLACVLVLACGATPEGQGRSIDVAEVKGTLSLGAQGPEVRAVHDFLRNAGYFENLELRRAFPQWFPVVAEAPTPDQYDSVMQSAVSAFQRLNGLEPSGVTDAGTLTLMASPRCGVPDIDRAQLDDRDKYLLKASSWPTSKTSLTYGFVTSFTAAQKAAVVNAFNTWAATTNLSFSENTSTPSSADFRFSFGPITNGCTDTTSLACTATASVGSDIVYASTIFNNSYVWTTTSPAPSGQYDLQSNSLHEIGHALGLDHTLFTAAVMSPFYNGKRVLQTDDLTAISLKYSPWQTMPGTALELAGGPDGAVYKLGETSLTGGRQMARWNESTQSWAVISNSIGATQISLGYGEDLWFSKSDGTVWLWAEDGLAQQPTPPSGIVDIGFASGALWALTGTTTSGCGKKTYKLSSGSWTNMGGCGVQIAVQGNGRPWVRDQNGNLKRYDGAGSAASDWVSMPGTASYIAASGVASDQGIAVWKTDWTTEDGNTVVRSWNETNSQWDAPRYGNTGAWLATPKGQPWLVDTWTFTIQRQRRD